MRKSRYCLHPLAVLLLGFSKEVIEQVAGFMAVQVGQGQDLLQAPLFPAGEVVEFLLV